MMGINLGFAELLAKKVGFVTFEEFCKDPERWTKKHNEILDIVSHGSDNLRRVAAEYEYKFGLYTTDKLERLEEMVLNEGYRVEDLEIKPHVEQSYKGNGRYKFCVEFILKKNKEVSDARMGR